MLGGCGIWVTAEQRGDCLSQVLWPETNGSGASGICDLALGVDKEEAIRPGAVRLHCAIVHLVNARREMVVELQLGGVSDGAAIGDGDRIADCGTAHVPAIDRMSLADIDVEELDLVAELLLEGIEAHGLFGERASGEAAEDQGHRSDPSEVGKADEAIALRAGQCEVRCKLALPRSLGLVMEDPS